jgi:DNA (cytosine-5)-methyltransferase 1
MVTVGSLFAGIGGFCSAFEQVGAKVLWANEMDSAACRTYRTNHPDISLHEKRIEDLSAIHDDLLPVDVLTAGFPCQPFSVAGDRKGFADPRGRAFFEIIRLIKEFGVNRPKILLFENVPGLLFHDKGASFAKIVNAVQSAGYWFLPPDCQAILNTLKITGIPQARDRLFMVALSWDHFDDQCFQFPEEIPSNGQSVKSFLDLHEKAPEDHYFDPESRWGKLFIESMNKGDPESVYQLRRYYVRENKNDAVFTLTANMGEGGHNIPVYKDDWGIRKLTTRECLRLQGFDADKFIFPEEVAKSQRYKQIGNAVTVPLVMKLAQECLRLLTKGR